MSKGRASSLPIDRGWAWVIAFSSCGIFAFVTGNFKCSGIILVELLEMFPQESAKSLIWIFSLGSVMAKLAGPLCGMLLAKTSNRTLSMMGVSLMSSSLIVFAYLPKTEYMYPVYGIGYGLGNCMVSLSVYTAYAPYFDKRKALSLGISTAGSGVGTMLIPAILRALFDNFTFSGAILLYAGVCLQTLILASLLRPMSHYEKWAELQQTSISKQEFNSSKATQLLDSKLQNLVDSENNTRERSSSVGTQQRQLLKPETNGSSNVFLSTPTNIDIASNIKKHKHHVSNSMLAYSMQDLSGSAIVFEPDFSGSTEDTNDKSKPTNTSFNWRLAYDPRSMLMGLTTLCFSCGLSVAYQCLPPLGKDAGVSKQLIATTMAICGILEIPARIGQGWLADRKFLSVYTQLALCMLITGAAAFFCAIISGTAGVIVMLAALSGVSTSVFSLLPIAIGGLLGRESLQSAMAINFVYQGVATIVASFVAGAIYDETRVWENVYFFIGLCNMIGCSIMLTTSIVECVKQRRQRDGISPNE